MVHKTSHRGVHSGNTLRAFNSRYSRRYHHQACIVSRVHPQLLQKLLSSPEEKAESSRRAPAPPNHNVAVDVALSLNKQCRWLLPKALIQQVSSDDIALASLTVSVLERHKLKRPASCVSFHSNSGEVRRIQPRNGRYFSFAFPTADGKSRRAARREHQEEMRALLQQPKEVLGKMVEVDAKPTQDPVLELGESEIRYEVYYPSPAKSSLSHNPKYIKQDVTVAPGDEGHSEHVLHGKPRKQHGGRQRKRMTLKDVDDCDLPAYSDALYYAQGSQLPDGKFADNEYADEEPCARAVKGNEGRQRDRTTQCLLSSLLEKAEQLQHAVGGQPKRRKKKSSPKSKQLEESRTTRGHIVYISDLDRQAEARASRALGREEDDIELVPSSVRTQQPASTRWSEVSRVLLHKDDVSVTALKDCFGPSGYFEAGCRPRKFLLDITHNVRELLKKKGVDAQVADNTEDVVSLLVFVYDGILDDEYHVYKIFINSRLQKGLKALSFEDTNEENFQGGLYKGTVTNLISKSVDYLDIIVEERIAKNSFLDSRKIKENPHEDSSIIFIRSMKKAFSSVSAISNVHIPSLEELLQEEPAFCDICYTDVSTLTQGTVSSTTLLGCRHRVCDECWIRHLQAMVRKESASRLTCPQHDCLQNVDVGVLLSLSCVDEAASLIHKEERIRIGASLDEKFCPDQQCGRVLRLPATPDFAGRSKGLVDSAEASDLAQQDVMCACGAHLCFHCLAPAHWPATCPQAAQYRATLLVPGALPDRQAEVYVDDDDEKPKLLTVTGKNCPRCDLFVTKGGGGAQVQCVCGQLFCWYCTKLGEGHDQRGCTCVNQEAEERLTTTVIFHHPDNQTKSLTKKVSLVERAAAHHQKLVGSHSYSRAVTALSKAVAVAAAKNRVVAEHVLKVCRPDGLGDSHSDKQRLDCSNSSATTAGETSSKIPCPDQKNLDASLLPVVQAFVKTAVKCNQDLHEVAEYSLVLLKDVPDTVLRRRALRISDDLEAYCSFMQSILDVWSQASVEAAGRRQQDAVRALTRMSQIQTWARSALASHVATIKKIRSTYVTSCQ